MIVWLRAIILAIWNSPNYIKAILFSKKVPFQIALTRLKICNLCPNLNPITRQCEKCFCFVGEKVKYESQSCPIKNW